MKRLRLMSRLAKFFIAWRAVSDAICPEDGQSMVDVYSCNNSRTCVLSSSLVFDAFCAVIDACGRGGNARAALEHFDQMFREEMLPSKECYNAAIIACCSGQGMGRVDEGWRKARDLIFEMRDAGLVPTVLSYYSTIKAAHLHGHSDAAVELHDDMCLAGREPPQPERMSA